MSVGFGFSVGDFISAIELVETVIDALRSSSHSISEYRELVSQLLSLESALIQVRRLDVGEEMYGEMVALRQAAAQCRRTIDTFWVKFKRYQPALGRTGSNSKFKDGWMKIKWAACRKEDIVRFKADLVGHTESIQLLLETIHMKKVDLNQKKQEEGHARLVGKVEEGLGDAMRSLDIVSDQGNQILDMASMTMEKNAKAFQMMLEIQRAVAQIPPQITREQPVILVDALGKRSPFHLEFVRSAEALVAVLKTNFQLHRNGAEKIEQGEFAIRDEDNEKLIDLNADWDTCFLPGQRVEMFMTFRGLCHRILKQCPHCHRELASQTGSPQSKLECGCGKTYHPVTPFRSIFVDEGQLGSNASGITQRRGSPGNLFKNPISIYQQEWTGEANSTPGWVAKDSFDARLFVGVVELWYHGPKTLPKASTSEERKNLNPQSGMCALGKTEDKNDEISFNGYSDRTNMLTSTSLEAIERNEPQNEHCEWYADWWTCCCGREVNPDVWGIDCPDCSHVRCDTCGHSLSISKKVYKVVSRSS